MTVIIWVGVDATVGSLVPFGAMVDAKHSTLHRTIPHNKEFIWPKTSVVVRFTNPDLGDKIC